MYYIKVNSEIYFENKQTYSVSMQSLYLPFYFFFILRQCDSTNFKDNGRTNPSAFVFWVFFIAGKRLHIYYSFLNIPKRKNKPLLTFYSVNEWHIKMFCFRFHSAFFFLFHVKKYQSVVLTLDDINDESPVFDYPSYQILIPEVHLPLIDYAY